MRQILKYFLLGVLILILFFIGYFSIGKTEPAKEISWGVNFSQKLTEDLGLDWQETYLALLDDLKVKNIKLITNWDLIEPEEGNYNFENLDWQIKKAEERGTKLLLVIGMRTPGWPECHLPNWAKNLTKKEQQEKILNLIEKIVLRYKDQASIWAWQVENESFFPFGKCPWKDKNFLKKEINLVKSLDSQNRPIIISDSGEFSFWITAANLGDIVGTTLHRRVYSEQLKLYVSHYWFKPVYYWKKAQIIKKLFGKEVICGELQAMPWCSVPLSQCSLQEQEKTMNLEEFQKNIEFAKKTGLKEFYLWGTEWWYWLKEKQNKPEIWNEARNYLII